MSTRTIKIPASYWDDFSERAPVDKPHQLPTEVARSGSRVTIEIDDEQAVFLLGDALFYSEGETDDTPRSVLRGAKRVVELLNGRESV